jgi:hypothetical protein
VGSSFIKEAREAGNERHFSAERKATRAVLTAVVFQYLSVMRIFNIAFDNLAANISSSANLHSC